MKGDEDAMNTVLIREEEAGYTAQTINQDALWKNVIWEAFEDFIIFFEPNLHREIDFEKPIDFLQQELFKEIIKKKKGTVHADQIIKVHLKSGEEKWILIHIEVEGAPNEGFPKRMFRYFYRIFDKYDREIVAFAVLTDSSNHNRYDAFNYNYFGTTLHYAYNVRKVSDYSDEALEQSNDLFSKVMLAAKYLHKTKDKEEARYQAKQKLMRDLLSMKEHSKESIRAVFYFIDYLLQLPKSLTEKLVEQVRPILQEEGYRMLQYNKGEPSPTLAELMAARHGEGLEQGLEQGLVEGAERERERLIFRLLDKGLNLETIAEFVDLDVEKVGEIAAKKK